MNAQKFKIIMLCFIVVSNSLTLLAQDIIQMPHSLMSDPASQQSLNQITSLHYANRITLEVPLAKVSPQIQRELISPVMQPYSLAMPDYASENNNILGMFVIAGYGKLKYNFETNTVYKFDYEFTKGGGVSLEIPLITLDERFSVYNELGFSQFKATAKVHYSDTAGGDPANNYYDIDIKFSPNTVTLSNIIRYTLTPGSFKYYIGLGIYNSFVVSSTNIKTTYHVRKGVPETIVDEAVPDPSVHGLMLIGATGFTYRNIGLEIRLDPGRNYTNKLDYAVFMPSVSALLHVRFNPK